MAEQFPENDNVRAKIRQILQRLRDLDEIEFLDEEGTYEIKRIQLRSSEGAFSGTEPSRKEVEREKNILEQAVESEPELTENQTRYTETYRRVRDSAFTEIVRDAYENRCAVCGNQRESPDGNPEVEAAHIYPKSEGGSDDVRNGVALCKLHHWAFDTGWLSFTDEHKILVSDSPEREGYSEFIQYEGESLRLPEKDEVKPNAIFLKKHRALHGFGE